MIKIQNILLVSNHFKLFRNLIRVEGDGFPYGKKIKSLASACSFMLKLLRWLSVEKLIISEELRASINKSQKNLHQIKKQQPWIKFRTLELKWWHSLFPDQKLTAYRKAILNSWLDTEHSDINNKHKDTKVFPLS